MKEKLKYIYSIATFEKIDTDNLGSPDTGCWADWGSFQEFEDAEYCVINNVTDIWETCYHYAIITKKQFNCVCACNVNEWYYKYNRELNKYELIEKPDKWKHYNM